MWETVCCSPPLYQRRLSIREHFSRHAHKATQLLKLWEYCVHVMLISQGLWPPKNLWPFSTRFNFYDAISEDVYTTVILSAYRNWTHTLITLFVRWNAMWWNKWMPAFRRGPANFSIYCNIWYCACCLIYTVYYKVRMYLKMNVLYFWCGHSS
jgi:hypothetical protein